MRVSADPRSPQMAPRNRPPDKLPDPWLFDSEALLNELDRCRELVLQIPITTPNATHFGIQNAINAIWNLQRNLRYLLQLHSEGQQQWQRRADKPFPSVRNTTPAAKLQHEQPMQAEDTDSGLHEHWTVDEAAAFFRARGGCRVVQPARLSMSRRTASQTRKQQKNVRYGNAFANFKRSALDENATSMAYALTVKPTSTARRQVTDHKRSTPTRTSPLFPRARKVDSRFPSEAIRSCQSIQPLRTGHAWHCSLDSSGRKGHFLAAIIRLLPTSSVFDSNCLYESAVMSSRLLNTIGLVVSIIGVWFLFFWGPPQPSFETGISIGLQDATPLDRSGKTVADHNREVEAKRKRYTTMSRVGLLLIIVGFVLQLCALWLPDPSRASS